ncbi:hypothetical protein QBC38DRAFT_34287 [Podospora fimiseda]|uniref:Uncharacterized protein n=1 Tax=Podospora fimiseda TaxID=252190 RepID=A0AAN7GPU1_9PEZI|nr:hypothetical protein QBC38DRAFT_34287 [Podospora fimiseda]
MGASHSIHIANASSKDIYVMASLNPDWAVVDSIADIGVKFLLGAAAGNLATATATALIPGPSSTPPKQIKSLKDIFSCLEAARQLLSHKRAEAGVAMVDSFKRSAIHIPRGEFKNVMEREILGKHLSVDGIASLLSGNAKNVSLVVMSEDGGRVAMWNTNSDHSWVCTDCGEIRRSKYGTIWQVNDKGRKVRWAGN